MKKRSNEFFFVANNNVYEMIELFNVVKESLTFDVSDIQIRTARRISRTSSLIRVSFVSSFDKKSRNKTKNVYLNVWNKSDLHARKSNAVYEFRSIVKGRAIINRRIVKKIYNRVMIQESAYDRQRIACSHEDIDYIDKYADMTKKKIDSTIMSILQLNWHSK